MIKRILHIVFFLFLIAFANAQQYNFTTYNVDKGLAQSQILSMDQDTRGFIWLASLGGGVSKFDGHSFTTYTIYEGLPSNHVWKIFCDSKGNIWAGTTEGLAIFKTDHFEKVSNIYGLRDDHIYDICEDKEGNLFFGTKNYGVFIYNGVNFKNYAINDGIGFSTVQKVYVDPKGVVWLGSNGYGLAKYEKGKFENVTHRMNLTGLNIEEIYNDLKGFLIVVTEEGLFKKQGNGFIKYEKPFDTELISSVKIDKNNTTWYGTYGDGLIAEHSDGSLEFYHEENGLPSNYIFQLFIGSSEKLWITTDGAGFARFDGKRFIHFNKNNILKNNIVKSIAVTKDSSYWFATEEGITRYFPKEDRVKNYNQKNELLDENVHTLSVSQDGMVWCGAENGVMRINPSNDKIDYFQLNLRVLSIFIDKENRVWIGSDDGILMYNGTTIIKRFKDSIPNLQINRIKTNSTGDLLFCTEMSFSIYDGKKMRNLKIADDKGTKEVMDVWEMPNQTYWLATNRGITVLDSKYEKIHITSKNGLTSDNLYFVCHFDNAIWVGGDRGIDKIYINSDGDLERIRNYGKDDGFVGVECNSGAFLMEKNRMWIGTIKGVSIYQPQYDELNVKKPRLHLLEIKLNYELVSWTDLFPEIKVENNIPKNLELPYYLNNLAFDYIAIDFINPEKIVYQYKLEGFDNDWRKITKETSVSYTNLPAGDYVFKLKSLNSDGVWSDVYSYSFRIKVPFWRSTWFFIILIPSILIGIYIFILIRTRQLNKTKRKLEETVRLRTMELNRQKNELEKLSIVADKMNDGVVICSPNGQIEWINDGFKRMAGFEPLDFNQSHFADVKTLQEISSHAEINEIIKNFQINRDPVVYDSQHKLLDGNYMWTRAALTPIYSEKGDLLKIVALYSDITDHIKYEETLAQTNKDLTDSIVYAKKIQEAILPQDDLIAESFPDYFIYYNPRDIVSGDFYWFTKINGHLVLAVADCTGHGVPGAFMSMIGNEFLHQIVNNSFITGPEVALDYLNQRIVAALHQEGGETDSRDGMDIGIIAINLTNLFCQYSGAFIPLFVMRKGELLEYEATKESIGGYKESKKVYLAHEFNLQKGDCIYLTTDGYIDQFGGELGKKFMRKRYKELILEVSHLPMKEQLEIINEKHHQWRGARKQTDDILVIGIRI